MAPACILAMNAEEVFHNTFISAFQLSSFYSLLCHIYSTLLYLINIYSSLDQARYTYEAIPMANYCKKR